MKGKQYNYFAGGNTPLGFYSLYDYIIPVGEAERIYLIKGGPGTGKSTFMKKIGTYFLDKHENVEYMWCSSDPDSLDGVVLKNRRIAFIDGTAPHMIDPKFPGAVDEIIDLGKYFDREKLIKQKNEIISYNKKISNEFEHAYNYLKCAAILNESLSRIVGTNDLGININEVLDVINIKKNNDRKGRIRKLFGSAITSKGLINKLNDLSIHLNNIYLVNCNQGYNVDKIVAGISAKITDNGYDVTELYCPMKPDKGPEHIISFDADVGVFTCNKYHDFAWLKNNRGSKVISLDLQSANLSIDDRWDIISEDIESSINKSICYLKSAKELHDELESFYIESMEHDAVNEKIYKTIEKIC